MGTRTVRWVAFPLATLAMALCFASPARADEDKGLEEMIRELKQALDEIREGLHEEISEAEEAARRRAERMQKEKAKARIKREKKAHGNDQRRMERIRKGLVNGIEALHALGGQDRAIGHLKELVHELDVKRAHMRANQQDIEVKKKRALEKKKKAAKKKARDKKAQKTERQVAEEWLELMHMAHQVLREAGREAAEVLEHAMHALKLALEGRRDEEAMHVRRTAPKRPAQAEALLLAAEILEDQGKRDRARWLIDLAKRFRHQAERARGREHREREHAERERHERDIHEAEVDEREALRQRLDVLRSALPALREAEKRDAVDLIERALAGGKMLLEGRQDEEARHAIERIPPLPTLAEILAQAGRLWRRFGDVGKAEHVEWLSKYYAKRAREQAHAEEEEIEEHEERERDRDREIDHRIERMGDQLQELRKALERMQRELREIARDVK